MPLPAQAVAAGVLVLLALWRCFAHARKPGFLIRRRIQVTIIKKPILFTIDPEYGILN